MKTPVHVFFALLAAGSLSAGTENIKTIDGKEYKNATITRAEPDGLMITFAGGIVKIPFPELPPELRERYHFDPQSAAQFRQQLEATDAELALQVEAAKEKQRQLNLAAVQAPPPSQPAPISAPAIRAPMESTSSLSRPPGSLSLSRPDSLSLSRPGSAPGSYLGHGYDQASTAQEIFSAYATNEIEADVKYKGAVYTLSGGKIESISSENGVGRLQIAVPWAEKVYFMRAYFPESSALRHFRTGDQLAFRGTIEGVSGYVLTVKDCFIPR